MNKCSAFNLKNLTHRDLWTQLLIALVSFILTSSQVFAAESARSKPDPSMELARRAALVTQLVAETQDLTDVQKPLVGSAVIIAPCLALTNFHVAFGKTKKDGGKIVLVKKRVIGHRVRIFFAIDPESGKFREAMEATVIKFANYMTTASGILGDMALLRLDYCVDPKLYSPLEFASLASSDIPTGPLMTVSLSFQDGAVNEVLVEEGCRSMIVTPIDGVFLSNCESTWGMSGSATYELEGGGWRLAGLNTMKIGKNGEDLTSISINARIIKEFIAR